jgi:ribose 5-phosphate isomerase A
VVDESKLSKKLGEKWHVPVEVLSFAHEATKKALSSLGIPSLRMKEGTLVRTDSGNVIYDLLCGQIDEPKTLDRALRSIPGVVETGLFCGRADVVLVAGTSGIRKLTRTS